MKKFYIIHTIDCESLIVTKAIETFDEMLEKAQEYVANKKNEVDFDDGDEISFVCWSDEEYINALNRYTQVFDSVFEGKIVNEPTI